ncbi:uncharacterized protein LOC134283407 [Saccostrea cucullata]|uniref:uncharacterized protein LOC134283407 n=1 Tax=Saccostrea cuccullata TaxID=36930 RepID=UPI002ED18B4C
MVKPVQETTTAVVCRIGQVQGQQKDENSIINNGKLIMNQFDIEGIKESFRVGKSTRPVKRNDFCIFNQSDPKRACSQKDLQKTSLGATQLQRLPNNIDTVYGKEYWRRDFFSKELNMLGLNWKQRRFTLGSYMLKFFLSVWKSGFIQLHVGGIKWKRKHFFCWILILMVTASASDCPTESVGTVKEVESCPLNKKEHDEAARNMNCSSLVSLECADLEYHCVVNGFGNGTVEVCAKRIVVHEGYCAEFNTRGKTTQISYSVKPENPPREYYYSTEAYKYPECYKSILPITNIPTLLSTTENTNELATTHILENDTKPMEEGKPNNNYTWVAAAVVGVILPCVTVAVLFLLCNRLHCRGARENVEGEMEGSKTDPLLNGKSSDGRRNQENSPAEDHPCMNGMAK